MSQFDNVSIIKEANVYFEGQVTSRSVIFQDGSRKTLGIMLPGEYEFSTDEKELMEISSGELDVLLPNSDWQSIRDGESFEVPANSKFQLKVSKLTDYCCSFIEVMDWVSALLVGLLASTLLAYFTGAIGFSNFIN